MEAAAQNRDEDGEESGLRLMFHWEQQSSSRQAAKFKHTQKATWTLQLLQHKFFFPYSTTNKS